MAVATSTVLVPIGQSESFWDRVAIRGPDECWLFKGADSGDGYGVVKLNGKTVAVHRLVIYARPGEVVLHKCDNPRCCNPRHLTIGTHQANVADRVAKGRTACGTKNGRAKLNEEQVESIYRKLREGSSFAALAREFGVDQAIIRKIGNGTLWKSVTARLGV